MTHLRESGSAVAKVRPRRAAFVVCCMAAVAVNLSTLGVVAGGPTQRHLPAGLEPRAPRITIVAAHAATAAGPSVRPDAVATPPEAAAGAHSRSVDSAMPPSPRSPSLLSPVPMPVPMPVPSPSPATAPIPPRLPMPSALPIASAASTDTADTTDSGEAVRYYTFGEVDRPAMPESDWNLDTAFLDVAGLGRLVFEVFVDSAGEVVATAIHEPETLTDELRQALEDRLRHTTLQPALRAGAAVASVRRIELSVLPSEP